MTCYVHSKSALIPYNFDTEAAIFETCQERDHVGLEYLFRLVFHLDALIPKSENTKFIITGNLKELPEYGDNIIAVLMWDEWCRPPLYAHKVGYVLSTYGFRFNNYLSKPIFSVYNAIKAFKTVWIQHNRLRFLSNFRIKTAFLPKKKRLLAIPLGYYRHEKVAYKNFDERAIDVHFAGSIYASSEKYKNPIAKFFKALITSPRNFARGKLVESLSQIQKAYPSVNITHHCFKGFGEGLSRKAYSEELMNTKICLAPRGSSLETYRLFEAMRSGCVVIADRQPKKWCYENLPVVFIDDWSDLESTLLTLQNDPKRLFDLHQKTLNWWSEIAAPQAAAQHVFKEMSFAHQPSESVSFGKNKTEKRRLLPSIPYNFT